LWREYKDVNGLQVAMNRSVLVRVGGAMLPIVALNARLSAPAPLQRT